MPMTSTRKRRSASSLVLFAFAFAGCNDPSNVADTLPRKAISGTVTLNGQPLAQGVIQFDPTPENKPPTTMAVGEIKDGKYAIQLAQGPVQGNYKVSISSRPPVVIGTEPGELPKPVPEKVPAIYNTKSTLTKEITAEAVQILDFDLK